ncbi:hypothetical protein SAMN05444349_14130 [Bacteroides faecichinchillae]|uniref:Uncharacterized protein n=1 Tax=Bacteroides faecichinchillae TaxID=871325 RepID=A0A1M5F5P1_9BACE|nr:hypothetical protein SAMN05444349_14130 [Bacteroides faecichinchillae]
MKTIHKIQNVIAVISLMMVMYLAQQVEMTRNETFSCIIMLLLTVFMLLERTSKEIHQKE